MQEFDTLEKRDMPTALPLLPRPALFRFTASSFVARHQEMKAYYQAGQDALDAQLAASNASIKRILGR